MIKKDLVVAVLLTFCLTVTLFRIISTTGQVPGYDIWLDFNDDGQIDMRDVGWVARAFGTSGTPINKTFVLLELQSTMGILNNTLEVRLPQREIISIPAAAFIPQGDPALVGDWRNNGHSLINRNDTRGIRFYAPVQLPHGVTITRLTIFWYDIGDENINCFLGLANQTDAYWNMLWLYSPYKGGPGYGYSTDHIINNATIDNAYQYHIQVLIPPGPPITIDYAFYYAKIEYEHPA